jgi:hypothetical protein
MWSVQLSTGEYLEAVPDLEFELNNQVFASGDASVLPGSFSFPFELPLTARNRVLLNHPDLVNNATPWATYNNVWVALENTPLFLGTLTIRTANPKRVSVTIVANPLAKLKETSIAQLDLGGDRTLPSPLAGHMTDTVTTPSAFDYAFLPMYIRGKVLASGSLPAAYHNYYTTDGTLIAATDSYAITPMAKLKYILSRLQIDAGYKFANRWQVDSFELDWLYLFSNRDLRTTTSPSVAPSIPATFRLNDFVPNIKVTDLLKRVCAMFNLGIFTNIFSRTISLEPLNNILKKQSAHNWTAYVVGETTIDQTVPGPNYYNYNTQTDTPPPYFPPPETVPYYNSIAEASASTANTGAVGTYFYCEGGLYKVLAWGGAGFAPQFSTANYVTRGAVVANNLDRQPYDNNIVAGASIDNSVINAGGVSRWVGTPEVSPTDWEYNHQDYPAHLMAYRGVQIRSGGAYRWPWVCHSVFDQDTDPAVRLELMENGVSKGTARNSLFWHGQYGLYNQWHALWSNMLTSGKPVGLVLQLPLSTLTTFQFSDKITIGSMDYIATRLRVQKSLTRGFVLVEASLLSVI